MTAFIVIVAVIINIIIISWWESSGSGDALSKTDRMVSVPTDTFAKGEAKASSV